MEGRDKGDTKISIHTPRVGGDVTVRVRSPQVVISIHTPRVGGDRCVA